MLKSRPERVAFFLRLYKNKWGPCLLKEGPHPTSGNRSRRMRQVTVIMAGLLGKGLPSPFFPVTLRLKPCGLF